MCGMSEGLRSPCLQPTPESRAHCVAAEREQRHFQRRNFGFLSIRRAASWARALFICLCTVGICAAGETRTFQTTSGGCINSNAQWNIKAGEREGENSFCWWGLSPFTAGSGSDGDVGNTGRDPKKVGPIAAAQRKESPSGGRSDLRMFRSAPEFSRVHLSFYRCTVSINCFFFLQRFDAKCH